MRELKSAFDFDTWINEAPRGSSCVYYKGLLMMDRQTYALTGGRTETAPDPLRIARSMWLSVLRGKVKVVQKKISESNYDYIAFKS